MMKVAIIGATGYGGAELIRNLHAHPRVSIHSVHATSLLGEPLSNSYPHMQTIIQENIQSVDTDDIKKNDQIIFMATPSGVATTMAKEFVDAGLKVIDLSGDFRIKDGNIYESWYGLKPSEQSLMQQAVYGLTEWVDEDLTEVN